MSTNYTILKNDKKLVKAWVHNLSFAEGAKQQLLNVASLPFVTPWVAAMPDVHIGKGATIGSVIPTLNAIIPAAVGVDLGCGMMAVKTSLTANDLPDNLHNIRSSIEAAVPHGRSSSRTKQDRGAWHNPPTEVLSKWQTLSTEFAQLCIITPHLKSTNHLHHLGTLGTGNHFIELCLDENNSVWLMLHSGSRGVGNRIGTTFIELAKKEMQRWHIHLPDQDLAYLPEGSTHFEHYVKAVSWAQRFAKANREVMMTRSLQALRQQISKPFDTQVMAVNCHHNYIQKEQHYGQKIWITRKGAVSAQQGEMGIIPGSMGTKSFIVRGLGNADSFCSCSHGAGRVMSRTEAKKRISLAEHQQAIAGVECRQDAAVIDESPAAYKPIEDVMAAQQDLVEIVHTLKQIICVKG